MDERETNRNGRDDMSSRARAIRENAGEIAGNAGQRAGEAALGALQWLKEFFITLAMFIAAWVRHDLRPKNRRNVFSRYLFPVAFFWWELIFRVSTTRAPGIIPIFYILFYSLGWGFLFYILTTILRPKTNRLWRKILLFVLALPYIIEYFVYRQFKVLYDLNTVTAGAGGVLTGFMADILRLVFSFAGLSHLFLFLLPYILYMVVGCHIDRARRIRMPRRIRMILWIIGLYLLNLVLIYANGNYRSSYRSEYNFQTAVGNFGLATGLRMEVRQNFFGGSNVSFETVKAETETAETKEAAPKVYGDNALDIDFNALAESADGTNKELDEYVATLTPSKQNEFTGIFKGKNLILITAEAFSGSIIDKNLTPTLYRLATKGINFTDYYLQATAGTTGGECENILGMLPTDGGSSMKDTESYHNDMTMGAMLNRFGYYGKMYHDNDYTYYDRNKTHINFGYSDGFMGYGNGMEQYVTKQWPESDLEMFQGTFNEFADKQPFNIYYMTVSGHSDYTKDTNAMAKKNWDAVANLDYSDRVKAYIAANLELENGLKWLVNALEEKGIADDTVIVLTGDHFPYGLDNDAALGNMPYLSELYGTDVQNYLQRDHNRLIIWSGSLEKQDPITVDTPTSAIDILPTLANLFGCEFDSRLLPGRDVFSNAQPLMFNLNYDWKTDKGSYINATKTFTPTNEGETVSDDYISNIRTIVRNKINYMTGFFKTDYFGHVFANYTFKTEKVTAASETTAAPVVVYETNKKGETVTDEAGSPVAETDESGNVVTRAAETTAASASGEAGTAAAGDTSAAGSSAAEDASSSGENAVSTEADG